jgi:predicted nucleic acid-binding protein
VSGFLLDTNVVSELVKPQPSLNVIQWMQSTDEKLLYLSVLTLGEIRKGITSLPESAKRARLEAWLDADLALRFSDRILEIDQVIADRWGRISGYALLHGVPLPVIDALLIATAWQHDLTLVTRDTQHLAGLGVTSFNPWSAGDF